MHNGMYWRLLSIRNEFKTQNRLNYEYRIKQHGM